MLITFISWIWIAFSSFLWGFAFLELLNSRCKYKTKNFFVVVIYGLVLLTAYAQYFSLFYKVSLAANIVLVIADAAIVICKKESLREYFRIDPAKQYSYIFSGLIVLFIGFITLKISSSPVIHYDSALYHEQAIHWIEDYGVVKGLGNLHTRLAYNSSLFSLQALFSLKFLFGQSLHNINGFYGFLLLSYSLLSMKVLKGKRTYPSDFLRICMFYNYYKNYPVLSSPETDTASLGLYIFIICEWLSLLEENVNEVEPYANICLLCLHNISMKVSVGMVVLLVIKPAIMLIQEKKTKDIIRYLLLGIGIIAPFLIRNIIISGYLLYPFPKIDLFNVDWKMNKAVAEYDKNEIKVWGWKDDGGIPVDDADLPLNKWYPIWAVNNLTTSKRRLRFYGSLISMVLLLLFDSFNFIKTKKHDHLVVSVTLTACFLLWFFGSPNYRYGRMIFIAPLMLCLGRIISYLLNKIKFAYLATFAVIVYYCAVHLYPLMQFDLDDSFLCTPADYNIIEVGEYSVNGITFYYPIDSDQAGYYAFPSSPVPEPYLIMRGQTLSEGFNP